MNIKPPTSQKISPISVKYSHIVSKPMYYSPKIKGNEPQTTQNKMDTKDFASALNSSAQQVSPPNSRFYEKSFKKFGSNEQIKPPPTNPIFDFKLTPADKNRSNLSQHEKDINVAIMIGVSTLRTMRKEGKAVKSEGDLHKMTPPPPEGQDSFVNMCQESLNKDYINNPCSLGIEPKPSKAAQSCQSTVLDKCLPKFVRNLNISPSKMTTSKNLQNNSSQNFNTTPLKFGEKSKKQETSTKTPNNGFLGNDPLPKKKELVESFANLLSNDSDLTIKPIKNIEFSANPFANSPSNPFNNSPPSSQLFKTGFMYSPPPKIWRIEDFELGKCLGKGRFGKVFLAREKKTRMLFALKCIVKKGMSNPACLEQLMREIKIHSFLNHINIIQLYGCFEDQLKVYLIEELAVNGNLFNQMHKQPEQRFEENVAAGYLRQILEAIRYLHSNYIIHRDIKPENILVSNGILKLADFGWSIYAPEDKRTTFCGTVDYVAPEIVTGDQYDAKVDLWSLGVLCFELTAGRAPFENRINREAFNNILNLKFKFPEDLSELAKDFVNRLLVKDPKKRYDIEEISNHPFLAKGSSMKLDICDKKIQEFKVSF